MTNIKIIDAKLDTKNPLAKQMLDLIVERGRIAASGELKKEMVNSGVCNEDAEQTIEAIQRLRK